MRRFTKIATGVSVALSALLLNAQQVAAQYYSYSTSDIADEGTWAFFTGMSLLCQIPLCIVGVASLAFSIWMIVDALKRDDSVLPGKIKWVILILFTGWVGALIYYFTRKKKMD